MKNHIKAMMAIIMLLATIAGATATWTQYSPSPTSSSVEIVKVIGTKALARSGNPNADIFYFNGSDWNEITQPSTITASGSTYAEIDKATDGNFYVAYKNNTHYQLYRVSPSNGTFTQILGTTAPPTGTVISSSTDENFFACIKDGAGYDASSTDADCYILLFNSSNSNYLAGGMNGASPNVTPMFGQSQIDPPILDAGRNLLATRTANGITANAFRFNGVSWTTVFTLGSSVGWFDIQETDGTHMGTAGSNGVRVYNSTSGQIDIVKFSATANALFIQQTDFDVYFGNATGLFKIPYVAGSPSLLMATDDIRDIDIDEDTDNKWAVGDNGVFYYEAQLEGETGTIEPETVYSLTRYQNSISGMSSINSVQTIGDSRAFTTGKNSSGVKIISHDTTNPNDIATSIKSVGAGGANPTSIAIYDDSTFLGTNADVVIFNNTVTGTASDLFEQNVIQVGGFSDYVQGLTARNDTQGFYCLDETTIFVNDKLVRFNLADDEASTDVQPCLDVLFNGANLYVHKGTSGIVIYNSTLSQVGSTITVLSNPSGATHDRLSIYGTTLFALTGRNIVKAFDISSPTSPSEIFECRSDKDIISIEALDDNRVILGTATTLEICDQENTALYDSVNDYFIRKLLLTYSAGETPLEISRHDETRFSVAENNKYSRYDLTIGTQVSIDLPPVITSFSVSNTAPCINQTTSISVFYTDPDTPLEARGGANCSSASFQSTSAGTSGEFPAETQCTFSTSGVKTITMFARDATTTVTTTTTVNVQECATSNFLDFKLLDAQSSEPLEGVTVNVIGHTSGTTDAAGYVSFNVATPGIYNVSMSKAGYASETNTYQTSNNRIIEYLEPLTINGSSRTQIVATVEDSNGNVLSGALVSATNPFDGSNKYAYADHTGTALILDPPTGVQLVVSASYDGFTTGYDRPVLSSGETEYLTFVLVTDGFVNLSSGRGCQDYISGVWLCSPLNTSGDGDFCNLDSDCITSRCGTGHKCDQFNYTQCDAAGMDRDARCQLSFSAGGAFKGVADSGARAVIKYFLYALFVILIFLAVIYWRMSSRR